MREIQAVGNIQIMLHHRQLKRYFSTAGCARKLVFAAAPE
jgi:hypothetical protein